LALQYRVTGAGCKGDWCGKMANRVRRLRTTIAYHGVRCVYIKPRSAELPCRTRLTSS